RLHRRSRPPDGRRHNNGANGAGSGDSRMKWQDRFRFVRQNMGKNKSRIFMTVLAAAMGCAFLIMLASVAFGLQNSLIKEITEGQTLTRIELYDKEVGGERA